MNQFAIDIDEDLLQQLFALDHAKRLAKMYEGRLCEVRFITHLFEKMMDFKLHITTSSDYLIRFYQYDQIYIEKDFHCYGPQFPIINTVPFRLAVRLADMSLSSTAFMHHDNKLVAAACYSKISFVDWSEECKPFNFNI